MGYKYDNWSDVEYIGKGNIFDSNLHSYLDFISESDMDKIKSYFEMKDLMKKPNNIDSPFISSL